MPSLGQVATTTPFHRSSFCTSGGCVEVALLPDHSIAVRDAKDDAPSAPVLPFGCIRSSSHLEH